MKTLKTFPKDDALSRAGERAMNEHYEKFKRETQELLRKQREDKEQKNKVAEKSTESAGK